MSFGFRPVRNTGTEPRQTPAMTHIAIVEQLDGNSTDWMEKVSDEQYGTPVQAQRSASAQCSALVFMALEAKRTKS
jgi:hypothetical protein